MVPVNDPIVEDYELLHATLFPDVHEQPLPRLSHLSHHFHQMNHHQT
jgi:hypothetical protein